jgi:glycerate 2-kinase
MMGFRHALSSSDTDSDRRKLRQDLRLIGNAALSAVDPAAAVKRYMQRDGASLRIAGEVWTDESSINRVMLLAVGKAAVPMAAAAVEVLTGGDPDKLADVRGLVVTKYDHAAEHGLPSALEVIEAGHPLPDANGLRAGEAVIASLKGLTKQDRVLLLLSGGGSSLLPAPVDRVTLDDLQALTQLLLGAGATIHEINTIRKHLSRLKGGQLARLAAPAPLAALLLSDVVGDRLDVIASGPAAPDPTSYRDALEIVERYGLTERVPAAVTAHLREGQEGRWDETPKPGDPLFDSVRNVIVGSNHQAASAAVTQATALGYHSLLLTTFVEGEAREVSRVAVALVKGIRTHGNPLAPPACLVWGGETTVTLRGKGKGGRNQELALAAALGLDGIDGVAVMALATDGTDGPTDAGGAIVDGSSAGHAAALGWNLYATLAENNAYPLLDATGDLLRIGPTGTNVNDLLVMLVA